MLILKKLDVIYVIWSAGKKNCLYGVSAVPLCTQQEIHIYNICLDKYETV